MPLTLVAERREPSGETLKNKAETVRLAPLRYIADSNVSTSLVARTFLSSVLIQNFLNSSIRNQPEYRDENKNELRNPTRPIRHGQRDYI
jgi:hypothetical protein